MASPTPPGTGSNQEGARATRRATTGTTEGARATGEPAKRPAWLIPLLALIGLLIAGGVIAAVASRGKDKDSASSTTSSVAVAAGSGTTASSGPASGASATTGSGASVTTAGGSGSGAAAGGGAAAGSGAAGSTPSGALVGGGGMAPTAANGALAAPNLLGDVLFAEAGTAIDAPAQAVITSAAQQISSSKATAVTVVGYTDALGDPAANQQLSLQRAQGVVAALQQQLPGSTTQFKAVAQGQTQAVASNDTPQGRQLNRRVAILAQ